MNEKKLTDSSLGVDEAVAEAKGQDTTGGRWAGGPLGQAVKEEQKKDGR